MPAPTGPFDLLDQDVSRLLAGEGSPADDEWALLRRLADRDELSRLLRAVLAAPELTSEIAARSYRHPLGFDKVVLLAKRPLGQLRLHIWWPGEPRVREHIHNHRFAFSSVVVCGEVHMRCYELADAGEAYAHFREAAEAGPRNWEFQQVGWAGVRGGLRMEMPAGTTYAMSAESLHRIDASPVLTATVLLETRTVRGHSSVYLSRYEGAPARYACPALRPEELADRLRRLVDHLAEVPTGASVRRSHSGVR